MIRFTALALLASSAIGAAAPAEAAFVSSINSTPTLIGAVVAGQSYTVTTTGTSDLFATFNGGAGLTFDADGIPTYAFPNPYSPFHPNGLSYDPSSGTNCVGGAALKCGALIGAIVASPGDLPLSYFALGSSLTFNAATSGFLVGVVNDVGAYYDNGLEGFTVTLASNAAAVPEAATWAMMVGGFGLVGIGMRARRKHTLTFA